jgi:ribonuclease HII
MLPYKHLNINELGIDEAGRGCLFGRVYIAGVILPQNIEELCLKENVVLKDSKKLSKKKRYIARDFIKKHSICYNIVFKESYDIDNINILQATLLGMHEVVDNIKENINIEHILVDGNHFIPYENIEHTCIINGDNTYMNIAAASILAKTYRDDYILDLCEKEDKLKLYDLHHNMGYGTARHIDAIKTYGITPYHRITFGICKKSSMFQQILD